MQEYYRLTGRRYDVVMPYRLEDAEYAIVGSGCMMETGEAAVDYMREKLGIRAGLLHLTAFRPFPSVEVVHALRDMKGIAVIERLDIPMMQSNPHSARSRPPSPTPNPAPRATPPCPVCRASSAARRDWAVATCAPATSSPSSKTCAAAQPRYYFTVGIKHQTALDASFDPDVRSAGSFSMRGHSVGGFGSVTTNKIIATIAGDVFGMDVQAYPKYGSEKKGLPTTYYLTIARTHIRVHSEMEHVEFVALNDVNAFNLENPLAGLAPGGMVFVQSQRSEPAEIWSSVPAWARQVMCEKNARLFALDNVAIAREVSSRADLQQRMQGIVLLGIFLRITPFKEELGLSDQSVLAGVEKALRKYFGKRGERVVQDNLLAVERGYREVIEVPREVMISTAAADHANAALRVV